MGDSGNPSGDSITVAITSLYLVRCGTTSTCGEDLCSPSLAPLLATGQPGCMEDPTSFSLRRLPTLQVMYIARTLRRLTVAASTRATSYAGLQLEDRFETARLRLVHGQRVGVVVPGEQCACAAGSRQASQSNPSRMSGCVTADEDEHRR
jgi:hypothetical protein